MKDIYLTRGGLYFPNLILGFLRILAMMVLSSAVRSVESASSSSSRTPQSPHFRRSTRKFFLCVSSCWKEQKTSKRRRILPEVPKQARPFSRNSCGNRVYVISDVHTDYRLNLDWIEKLSSKCYQRDTLIVAGDVSDNLETFAMTMTLFKERFAHVFFVPGNHDLWCRSEEDKHMNSVEKLEVLDEICKSTGIETKPKKVNEVWIVPLLSWYHQSFDKEMDIVGYNIPSLEKICVDSHACKWPAPMKFLDITVAAYFDNLNSTHEQCLMEIRHTTDQVITFSHFVPRPELCPEKRMLFYPNLPKVIGSDLLEARLRSIHGFKGNPRAFHVFGHTHFCWDATIDGIRYVQAPLAYPRERERRLNGGEDWLPLCIFDSEAGGLIDGPLPCHWSDYYRSNKRDPNNVELAPWVADLYHSKP